MIQILTPKFALGKLVATPGALAALEESKQSAWHFFFRHVSADWGELCEEDKLLNQQALEEGGRLLSTYRTKRGKRLYVITEADRSLSTILLVEEY